MIILIIYLVFNYIFGIYIINSNNMFPSLVSGQLIIYYRLNNKFYNKDVIVYNKKLYRIVGISNDEINIDNNYLTINGYREEDETFYKTNKEVSSNINYPYKIEKDKYFVLNDYRLDTNDSRLFGAINKEEIDGLLIASIKIRDF